MLERSLVDLFILLLKVSTAKSLEHKQNRKILYSTPSATEERATTAAGSLSQRWTAAATIEFERLYNQREGKWTFAEFQVVWPKDVHGPVSSATWANKNLTVRRKLKKQEGPERKKQRLESIP